MKIDIKSGGEVTFSVNAYGLIEGLNEEQKLLLADAVAVQDSVIKYVGQQILDGWTDHVSCAAKSCGDADPHWPLGKVIREVAKRSGDVAREEIEKLEESLRRAKETNEKDVREIIRLQDILAKHNIRWI